MQLEALGVQGTIAVRLLNDVNSVVFNALTKHEYELPAELFDRQKTHSSPTEATPT